MKKRRKSSLFLYYDAAESCAVRSFVQNYLLIYYYSYVKNAKIYRYSLQIITPLNGKHERGLFILKRLITSLKRKQIPMALQW
jgi:hypothetical protein